MLCSAIDASRERFSKLRQALRSHVSKRGDIEEIDGCFSFGEALNRDIYGTLDSGVHHDNYQSMIKKTQFDLVAIQRTTVEEDGMVIFCDEGGDVVGKAGHSPHDGLFRPLADPSQPQSVERELPGIVQCDSNSSFERCGGAKPDTNRNIRVNKNVETGNCREVSTDLA